MGADTGIVEVTDVIEVKGFEWEHTLALSR